MSTTQIKKKKEMSKIKNWDEFCTLFSGSKKFSLTYDSAFGEEYKQTWGEVLFKNIVLGLLPCKRTLKPVRSESHVHFLVYELLKSLIMHSSDDSVRILVPINQEEEEEDQEEEAVGAASDDGDDESMGGGGGGVQSERGVDRVQSERGGGGGGVDRGNSEPSCKLQFQPSKSTSQLVAGKTDSHVVKSKVSTQAKSSLLGAKSEEEICIVIEAKTNISIFDKCIGQLAAEITHVHFKKKGKAGDEIITYGVLCDFNKWQFVKFSSMFDAQLTNAELSKGCDEKGEQEVTVTYSRPMTLLDNSIDTNFYFREGHESIGVGKDFQTIVQILCGILSLQVSEAAHDAITSNFNEIAMQELSASFELQRELQLEKQRVDEQTQRADEQTQRADEQTQRADEQTQRADELQRELLQLAEATGATRRAEEQMAEHRAEENETESPNKREVVDAHKKGKRRKKKKVN
jgi:hypothetical protein